MRRSNYFILIQCLIAVALCIHAEPAAAEYQLTVVTDRPDAIYSVGENVRFKVTLTKDKEPVTKGGISYILNNDGTDILAQGVLDCTGWPCRSFS